MAVNKVIYDGNTLMDLTGDTVTPETLAEGQTAHAASGERIVGTMPTDVVRYGEQTLTEAQQAQARENIGITSVGGGEVFAVIANIVENGADIAISSASHTFAEISSAIAEGKNVILKAGEFVYSLINAGSEEIHFALPFAFDMVDGKTIGVYHATVFSDNEWSHVIAHISTGSKPRIGWVELSASAWKGSGNLYSQVVDIDDVTEYSQVDLTPSVEQLAVFYEKDLTFVTENEDGVVTVYAIGQKPTNDYTIQVTITEVNV